MIDNPLHFRYNGKVLISHLSEFCHWSAEFPENGSPMAKFAQTRNVNHFAESKGWRIVTHSIALLTLRIFFCFRCERDEFKIQTLWS